eukprot:TRINITY_DN37571_c0_g1_i1.p1 TRINITY_DN37571_c0_g1~~TRINITY_DN37571_c0_g1_i1.p1  ORF type:complete len:409 (+),score=65.19 TRINITY_DN37571_c0_g1_i1:92-1318(+)
MLSVSVMKRYLVRQVQLSKQSLRGGASVCAAPRTSHNVALELIPSTLSQSRSAPASMMRIGSRHFSTEGESGKSLPDVMAMLKEFGKPGELAEDALQENVARLQASEASIQRFLLDSETLSFQDRLSLLQALASLGTVSGRPYPVASYLLSWLQDFVEELEALNDGETIAERARVLREVLLCFHRAGLAPDRLKLIYAHIEKDFPRFEAVGALLPMKSAVSLCHTMLATGLSSPPAVVVLLRAALRESLLHVADDSQELRLLKTIEILVRLDFLHTQEQLPPDVSEYLSVIRNLRYYDRELRRDTPLSYQMAYFLRKHGFPAKRKMLGPYALKVCDPEERINFEPVEERTFRSGLSEEPTARKQRHLEAVGWRSIEVTASTWKDLGSYDAKAAHIRKLLQDHDLLSMT